MLLFRCQLEYKKDTGHFFPLCCYFSLIRQVLVRSPPRYSVLDNVSVSVGAVLTTALLSGFLPLASSLRVVCCWLTASPPSPPRWGSSARWDSGPVDAAAPPTRLGWSPFDLWPGFCDSWSGLRTAPTGWWDRGHTHSWTTRPQAECRERFFGGPNIPSYDSLHLHWWLAH